MGTIGLDSKRAHKIELNWPYAHNQRRIRETWAWERCMAILGEFVADEAGVSLDKVMLLRHSSATMKRLRAIGVTVKQYTEVQPKNKPYNYYGDPSKPIEVVVVVIDGKVNAIFKVLGSERRYKLRAQYPETYGARQAGSSTRSSGH
jgi:hypothetical protein